MELIILHYSYWILLPLMILEGPIITIVAAFLACLGYLNIYLVYILALIGDDIGDALYYQIGRYGRHGVLNKFGHRIGLTDERLEQAKQNYFHSNTSLWKIITFGKITHAPSGLIMFTSGALKADFKKYLLITTINNIFKVLIFVLIGYFFGSYYKTIDHYLGQSWVIFIPILLLAAHLFYRRKYKLAKNDTLQDALK